MFQLFSSAEAKTIGPVSHNKWQAKSGKVQPRWKPAVALLCYHLDGDQIKLNLAVHSRVLRKFPSLPQRKCLYITWWELADSFIFSCQTPHFYGHSFLCARGSDYACGHLCQFVVLTKKNPKNLHFMFLLSDARALKCNNIELVWNRGLFSPPPHFKYSEMFLQLKENNCSSHCVLRATPQMTLTSWPVYHLRQNKTKFSNLFFVNNFFLAVS